MGLNIFTPATLIRSAEVNENTNLTLRQTGLNFVRLLEQANASFSTDGQEFAEAYIGDTGRELSVLNADSFFAVTNNDVNKDSGTAPFFPTVNKINVCPSGNYSADTLHNPDSIATPDNFFNTNILSIVDFNGTGSINRSLGRTFSERYISKIYARATVANNNAPGGSQTQYGVFVETFNGSTWDIEYSIMHSTSAITNRLLSISRIIEINKNCQGVRVRLQATGNSSRTSRFRFACLEYGESVESEITHTIPSGQFPVGTDSAFATALAVDWEDGAEVEFKLTNGTDDSGWHPINSIAKFTPFEYAPEKLVVKLIPKSTSPSPGYPSIKGVALFGGN